ncbi:efflux RND transporter periplasmic adaptor subunit [Methylosinus sp. C49]|uniref:efflux RND transporter periplasmic adaptor subunit n=1 Tax=Methylosinus sp. C49 TaxID=2699395 RepID=UPI001FCF2813|nr:efflux RND transporter periplasmic adaptor subunit [Methylosinus sp. C49]
MFFPRRPRTAAIILVAAALALYAFGFGVTRPNQTLETPKPRVVATKPTVRTIVEWDRYTGRFSAVESVQVRARVSGYLTDIHFADGQLVKEGDRLFTIDRRPFELAVSAADAERRVAESAVALARQELSRAQSLRKIGVAEEVYEQRMAALRQAEARLAATGAALDRAKLDLEFTNVRAPIAGRIDAHSVSVGNLVSGGDSNATLLTNIVSLDPIRVTFDVDQEAYLRYIRGGSDGGRPSLRDTPNSVRIALSGDADFTRSGELDFVSNQIDRDSATIRLRAIVDNKDLSLVPGLFARIELAGSGAHPAVMIPDEAISVDQASHVVFVVDRGTAERRTVTLGPIVEGLRVVRSGVGPDDFVVTSGSQNIRAGQAVAILDAAPAPVSKRAAADIGRLSR